MAFTYAMRAWLFDGASEKFVVISTMYIGVH